MIEQEREAELKSMSRRNLLDLYKRYHDVTEEDIFEIPRSILIDGILNIEFNNNKAKEIDQDKQEDQSINPIKPGAQDGNFNNSYRE